MFKIESKGGYQMLVIHLDHLDEAVLAFEAEFPQVNDYLVFKEVNDDWEFQLRITKAY